MECKDLSVFEGVQIVHYYAVMDNVAEEFLPMFPAKSDADAVRTFKHGFPKDVNMNDFGLFHIGVFVYDKNHNEPTNFRTDYKYIQLIEKE